jgi:hypothetical protein
VAHQDPGCKPRLHGRGETVAEHRAFDDGQVVVDFDADGRAIGIELLAGLTFRDLPELQAFVRQSGDEVRGVAATTLVNYWPAVAMTFKAVMHTVKALGRSTDARKAVPIVQREVRSKIGDAWLATVS